MKKFKDPTQEELFMLWVEEAIKHGYIKKFIPEKDCPKFPLFEGYSRSWTETKIIYKGTQREQEKILTHEHILLRPAAYGPDGIIVWTEKAYHVLFADITDSIRWVKEMYFTALLVKGEYMTVLDVKAPTGTNRHSDTPFQFTRKMMWDKHKIFVNKVMLVPPKSKSGKPPKGYLYNEVWTPHRYLWSDGLTKLRSINSYTPITVEQFSLP